MIGTLVDSNILLDVFTRDIKWYEWSSDRLSVCANQGNLYINPIIYAEVSVRFVTIEDFEAAMPQKFIRRLDLPIESAFLAGKAFKRYRDSGGTRTSTLPDFFIGAHAAVAGLTLITRDARNYQTYFPTLSIISP